MATSSNSAARRSLRPHTAPNVRENLRRERERFLARQTELESLAAPINEVAAKLAKLDAVIESRESAPLRRIEKLEKTRDQRIQKIQDEFAAKIDAVKTEAAAAGGQVTPEEAAQESALLRDYALAIVEFSNSASASELAPLLGVSSREAKKIIEQAKADLGASGAAAAAVSTEPAPTAPADDKQPVTVAS